MSRPRTVGACGALSLAVLALSGCSGSGSTPASSSTVAPATSRAAGYVLSAPASVKGWQLTSPSSTTQQKMQQGLGQAEQAVGGVSGTPVMGLYDDTTDQDWLVFVGLNGSFDPAKLATAAEAAPTFSTDALGDRMSTTWVSTVSAGPNGGQVDCQQTQIVQAGLSTFAATGLAAEGTACYWMTPTTFGVVTIYPQANRNDWSFGYDAQQMDAFMLDVRAAAERRAG